MHLLTIIWTLICALVIIGYPLYLLNKSAALVRKHQENLVAKEPNTVELLSFDIRKKLPGWSFSLDIPQLTEDILRESPILFYLESEDTCLKLPMSNTTMGYKANVYKNVGKVYVTFKSLKDGVSHFYVPNWHLSKLKVLIIKPQDRKIDGENNILQSKAMIQKNLTNSGININDYEDVLGYLSNITSIDFKGHFIPQKTKGNKMPTKRVNPKKPKLENEELYATILN